METLIYFIVCSLFISTLFTIGLWISSRGTTKKYKDGKSVDTDDMILYSITKYFTQSTIEKVYIKGDGLKSIINEINSIIPITSNESQLTFSSNVFSAVVPLIEKYAKDNGYKLYVRPSEGYANIYYEVEKFKFSKYIRKPIIGCYKCYASFWGIPLFSINYKLSGLHFSTFEFVYLLIIHTFALVVVNSWVNKKVG